MRNTVLNEAKCEIKIDERNINNQRYTDDTTLMAESEEELKSLPMKVFSNMYICFKLCYLFMIKTNIFLCLLITVKKH